MLRIALSTLVLVWFAGNVLAFGIEPGTHNLGSEHEKITRAAVKDLDPKTLSQLAGSGEDPGAVGLPDTSDRGLRKLVEAHCYGGDFLDPGDPNTAVYAQSAEAAHAALTTCRQFIMSHLDDAIGWAGALVKADAEAVAIPCRFDGKQLGAKCNVLENLGLAFHASQDFYAHTNWVDRPAKGPLTPTNPPGMNQSGRAKWLDPRLSEPFPEGLISGCPGDLRVLGVTFGCEYGMLPPLVGKFRVMRQDLAKDTGPIGGATGGIGTSPRGQINGNFARAVAAAVEDTADKWAYFKEQVARKYGQSRATRILCILKQDEFNPGACADVVAQSKACSEREAALGETDNGDVYVPQSAPSAAETRSADELYESLRNFCVIEETDITRSSVINGGTADAARTNLRADAVHSLALWKSCPAELGRHLSEMTQTTKQAYEEQVKKPHGDPKIEMQLLIRTHSNCILGVHLQKLGK